MTHYWRQLACALAGAALGWAVAPATRGDDTAASYAAEHAGDCERQGRDATTAAALDPQRQRDQLYSAVACAGYETGRFDAAVAGAGR